jgi:hypothetical protein
LDRVEGRRDICWPQEVTDDNLGAEPAQGIGAVVIVVRQRSYGLAALTEQRHNLVAHAADSPAGTGHQDETRFSHRPSPFVVNMSPGPSRMVANSNQSTRTLRTSWRSVESRSGIDQILVTSVMTRLGRRRDLTVT